MSATCAWCQDLAAKRADDDLAEKAAKAIIEVARLTEELAQATVALHRAEQERAEARAEVEWTKDRLVEAREECDRQRTFVARLAEAAGLADVWDPDALVQGVERLRADKP